MVAVAEPLKPVSDAGLMPAGWTSVEIGPHIDLLTGFPFPSRGFGRSGARLVRGSNVKRGVIDWSDDITEYWPIVTPDIRKYLLKPGDIVIAMDGALVGHSYAEVSEADLPSLLLQRVARVRSKNISQKFLKSWICSSYFTQHCDALKTNTAIPHISPTDIRSFRIVLPPTIAEQDAIAEALSDADAYIESLEQLLAKKRALMQGAAQELLTGKRRLPGFTGEWITVNLGAHASFKTGPFGAALHKSDYVDGGVPVVNPMQIIDGKIVATRSMSVTEHAARRLSDVRLAHGDVVIGRRGDMGRCAAVNSIQDGWLCGTGSMIIRPDDSLDPVFLQCCLSGAESVKALTNASIGSTMSNLNQRILASLKLRIPPTKEEQHAIATVLRDLDTDIAQVQAMIDKARDVKQGMMQELLTGRVRLV